MSPEKPHGEINWHKMAVGGDVGGIIFAVGAVVISLIALPELRYFLISAIGLGAIIALVLHILRR